MAEKLALTVREAAALLGVSPPLVYELIHRSDFPSFTVGKRRLISRAALEEWVLIQAQSGAAL